MYLFNENNNSITSNEITEFDGQRYIYHENQALNILSSPDKIKLEGEISWADEHRIIFYETTTGSRYLVELEGVFQKNKPLNVRQIKGDINKVIFYDTNIIIKEFLFY